jgi:hypothetical protein
MSTILDRLNQTGTAMNTAEFRDQLGFRLKRAAIEAMMAGIGSKEWNSYMSLFANNTEQLNRLTVRGENEDLWLLESRAYMVANSICGADSTTQTSLRVDLLIDESLNANSDNSIVDPPEQGEVVPPGAIVRPFRIPSV